MKTNVRSIAQFFLAILFLGQTWLCAQEQWFSRHLLSCKQRKTSPTESRESVAFIRAYPFETKPVNVEANGQNLIQFLATEDSLARSVDKLMRLSSAPLSSAQTKDKSKNPFFFSSQAYSDCVLIVRRNTAVVFPRFMLLNPFFQQILIREDDFVATVRSRQDPDGNDGTKDLIADFLLQGKTLSRPAEISVTVAGAKQGAVESFMDSYRRRAKGGNATFGLFFIDGKTFESVAYDPQSENLLDQRLLMLTRLRSGLSINYIIPFKESGAMGSAGSLIKNATVGQNDTDWADQTFGLQSTLLQDGDNISVVTVASLTTQLR